MPDKPLRLTTLPECPRCKATNSRVYGNDPTGELLCIACNRPFTYTRHVRYTSEALPDEEPNPVPDFIVDRSEDREFSPAAKERLLKLISDGKHADLWSVVYSEWPELEAIRNAGGANFTLTDDHRLRIYFGKSA